MTEHNDDIQPLQAHEIDDTALNFSAEEATPDDGITINLGDYESEAEPELNLGPVPTESDNAGLNLDFETMSVEADNVDINLDFDEETAEEPQGETEISEDAEQALKDLRERLGSEPGDWYVVHTYSGMENRVKQNLDSRVKTLNMEEYIYEAVVPTETVEELRGNQRKQVTRTILPGYVLVRMELTDESWSTVRHTPSVTGFVGHAQDPVPISLDDVEKMLAPSVVAAAALKAERAGRPTSRKRKVEVADFAEGDNVMVVDGPFAGIHATITEINVSSQRLKALVEMLGRETPVDLTFAQIQKV